MPKNNKNTEVLYIRLPKHTKDILLMCAAYEGKEPGIFARDGLMGYCRYLGYLDEYDFINKSLIHTDIQL